MATVKDVVSLMEEIAPLELSRLYCQKYGAYDNSGLLIGDEDRQIFTVLVCLDLTEDVAAEAVDISADMIITHHPFIYGGISNILKSTPQGKIIHTLIKNDIAVYSAHLSFDIAPFGINQIMADRLELSDCKVLLPVGEEAGLGRVGKFSQPKTLREIYDELVLILNDRFIKVSGDLGANISTAAVVCGSGGDMDTLNAAREAGAELLITGEVKHHVALAAKAEGIAIIDAGHYSTEYLGISALCQAIASYAESSGLDIEVTESLIVTNPFETL